jgi:hypothetical protein
VRFIWLFPEEKNMASKSKSKSTRETIGTRGNGGATWDSSITIELPITAEGESLILSCPGEKAFDVMPIVTAEHAAEVQEIFAVNNAWGNAIDWQGDFGL